METLIAGWFKKQLFQFRLTYFDLKGKPLDSCIVAHKVRWKPVSDSNSRMVHMGDIAAYIRGMRDNGGQDQEWEGAVLIECIETGELRLVLPRSTF